MTTWAEVVAPILRKFEVAAAFNQTVVFNADGADAVGKLMKKMAQVLDEECKVRVEHLLPAVAIEDRREHGRT